MSLTEIVTVFTDASHSRDKAGWAAWAKFRGETMRWSSGITFPISNISDAETIAVTCGILRSIKEFDLPPDTIMVVQSDSTDALAAMLYAGWSNGQNRYFLVAKNTDVKPRMPNKINQLRGSFAQKAFEAVRHRNITVYLKHVRAHTGKDDPRSWVNEWCDGMAKKEMRAVKHQTAEPITA
jgi:ribonuclease HI